MDREIEVKVLGVDLKDMERRLMAIGAKLVSKEYQINILLDTEHRFIKNDLGSYLRIRETKDLLNGKTRTDLTLKKNISKEGVRENIEISSRIEDRESLIRILEQLGYKIIDEGYKDRTSYVYEDIRFDLDKWDKSTYPYPYMEIEVEREQDLDRAIELLEINKDQISVESIMELRGRL
ncbi:MAG TPA: class IV adenylate cyclase [Tepidimicrobium sp.]|nr:class IV adenylate cyclase [Tepidimicrobium sp.]